MRHLQCSADVGNKRTFKAFCNAHGALHAEDRRRELGSKVQLRWKITSLQYEQCPSLPVGKDCQRRAFNGPAFFDPDGAC